MNIYKPSLTAGERLPLLVTQPKHFVPGDRHFTSSGAAVVEMGRMTGAREVTRSGLFQDVMLEALDKVSGKQMEAEKLFQKAIIEPGSVDAHDITTAEAKANLSFNITRTILDRIVRGWNQLINTR